MNLIEPKKLKMGDTIAIIAPCGCVDIEKVYNAKKYFEKLGYEVKLGKNIEKCDRYLAGSDNERIADLENAFLDNEVKAIVCARGGYGAIRIIDKINYEIIRQNPKIFCGYSDITAFNAMFLKNAGLITYSGAMAQPDFGGELDKYTEKMFFEGLTSDKLRITPEFSYSYKSGDAEGILFGGNLSTITSLCGMDFIPDNKFLFFAEDLNEPAYKIDRYFTQLLNIEKFKQNLNAILLGDFLDVDEPEYLDKFFKELASTLNIPIVGGYPFTHETSKATVPIGAYAKLENGIIILQ